MAANPDYRYASAGAVRADLDLVLSGPLARVEHGAPSRVVEAVVPVTTSLRGKKAPKKSSTKPLILGLGAAALVIAGLVVILAGKRGEPESLPAFPTDVIVEKTSVLPVQAATPAPAAKTPEPVAKAEPPKAEPKPAVAPAPPVAMVEKKAEAVAAPTAKPESPPTVPTANGPHRQRPTAFRPAREPARITNPVERLSDGAADTTHRSRDQIRTRSRLPA